MAAAAASAYISPPLVLHQDPVSVDNQSTSSSSATRSLTRHIPDDFTGVVRIERRSDVHIICRVNVTNGMVPIVLHHQNRHDTITEAPYNRWFQSYYFTGDYLYHYLQSTNRDDNHIYVQESTYFFPTMTPPSSPIMPPVPQLYQNQMIYFNQIIFEGDIVCEVDDSNAFDELK